MTTRTWAEKKVEKAWQKHRGGLLDFTSGLIVSEHARAVRIVKRLAKDVNGPTTIYDEIYKEACADILAALQKGRA